MNSDHDHEETMPDSDSEDKSNSPDFSTERLFSRVEEETIPEQIGPYRIRRKIAEGGMGIVFEAMQDSPRRKVALKVIKPGVVSRRELRRFTFESQILARLRHHGIAQVYQAGVHESEGATTPYFVMEYIPHPRTILEYATKKHLDLEDRIRLFRKVLDAVHHGHQKGIIHRDLKPGNILVDPTGQPKVIDFGVARATDSDQVATTLQTDVGGIIGTLQYMSPEQFDAHPDDLDIRSDVYALGVVLFELTCEELPYDLTSASLIEAARTVKEDLPARPSKINREIRGDLETILLKSLEKNRDRRYQSALELEQDLVRYMHREPIKARRPSTTYHIRMFARRHTGAFLGMVAIFLLLVLGTIVVSILLGRAIEAENVAENKAFLAKIAQNQASKARDEVEEKLKEVERLGMAAAISLSNSKAEIERRQKLLDFTSKHLLRAIDPTTGSEADPFFADRPFKETVDRALASVSEEFKNQPELESRIRTTFAESYYNLGESQKALQQFKRAFNLLNDARKPEERDLLRLRAQIAMIDFDLADNEASLIDARRELESILSSQVGAFGEADPDALATANILALAESAMNEDEQAEIRLRRINELIGPENKHRVSYIMNLGSIIGGQMRYEEGIEYLDRAILEARRTRSEHSEATALNQKVLFLFGQGKNREALRITGQLTELNEKRLHESHPHAINVLGTRVLILFRLNRLDDASETLNDIERRLVSTRDVESEQWQEMWANFIEKRAAAHFYRGDLPSALDGFLEAEAHFIRTEGPKSTSAMTHGTSAAVVLEALDRHEEAIQQYEELIDRFSEEEQSRMPSVLAARTRMGEVLISMNRLQEAHDVLLAVIQDYEANDSPFSAEAILTRHDMARVLQRMHRYQDSIKYSNDVVQRSGEDLEMVALGLQVRAKTRAKAGDLRGARIDFDRSFSIMEEVAHHRLSELLADYAQAEEDAGNPDRAAEIRDRIKDES